MRFRMIDAQRANGKRVFWAGVDDSEESEKFGLRELERLGRERAGQNGGDIDGLHQLQQLFNYPNLHLTSRRIVSVSGASYWRTLIN